MWDFLLITFTSHGPGCRLIASTEENNDDSVLDWTLNSTVRNLLFVFSLQEFMYTKPDFKTPRFSIFDRG